MIGAYSPAGLAATLVALALILFGCWRTGRALFASPVIATLDEPGSFGDWSPRVAEWPDDIDFDFPKASPSDSSALAPAALKASGALPRVAPAPSAVPLASSSPRAWTRASAIAVGPWLGGSAAPSSPALKDAPASAGDGGRASSPAEASLRGRFPRPVRVAEVDRGLGGPGGRLHVVAPPRSNAGRANAPSLSRSPEA